MSGVQEREHLYLVANEAKAAPNPGLDVHTQVSIQ